MLATQAIASPHCNTKSLLWVYIYISFIPSILLMLPESGALAHHSVCPLPCTDLDPLQKVKKMGDALVFTQDSGASATVSNPPKVTA